MRGWWFGVFISAVRRKGEKNYESTIIAGMLNFTEQFSKR